jgi:hypothetical protein
VDALAIPTRADERYPLEYRRDGTDFILSFRYAGPGMNECRYASVVRRWRCSGYF